MSPEASADSIHEIHYHDFATSMLPLYAGPQVKIRIGPNGPEYQISKALICKQSPYFAALFEGKFQEGEELSATLDEVDNVVSVRSLELLIQWLHLGRVSFDECGVFDTITAMVEFLRFADMCGVTGMEHQTTNEIKAIMIANSYREGPNTNTRCITSENVISASSLPNGHPLRSLFAAACVKGYLQSDDIMILRELEGNATFLADFLGALQATLKSLETELYISFQDPLREERVSLKS